MIYKVTVVVSYLERSREYAFHFVALIYLINFRFSFHLDQRGSRHEEAYAITISPTRTRLKRR